MSTKIRKDSNPMAETLAAAFNQALDYISSSSKHRDKTAVQGGDWFNPTSTPLTITGLTTDLTTCEALAEEVRGVLHCHLADDSAHLLADTVNVAFDGYAAATTQALAITLANAEKLNYNAHMAQSGIHQHDDSTNTVSASDATDLASLQTLLADIKTKVNLHMANAGVTARAVYINP